MKNLNSFFTIENLKEFSLSNEEMITVRGGENDEIIKPAVPPVII